MAGRMVVVSIQLKNAFGRKNCYSKCGPSYEDLGVLLLQNLKMSIGPEKSQAFCSARIYWALFFFSLWFLLGHQKNKVIIKKLKR